MRALSSQRVKRLTRLSGFAPSGILVATLGSWVLLLPTIPLMKAASVVKCRVTVPGGWPGYPCNKASRMARYRRRLSLMVCSCWMGRSFQRVYDEPTSEVLISKYLTKVSGGEISHLDEPAHRLEAHSTWAQPDSPIRQLIRMSGCHPQSLRLLARQMGRKGLTLARLRDEAHADL